MSEEDRKSLYFGFFLCIGIIGLFSVMFFFPKNQGDSKQEIRVAFTHLSGVSKGMNVCLAGKRIGSVVKVQDILDKRVYGDEGQLYCYELVLKIDSSVALYQDDIFAMYSPKVIGESIINIIPGAERKEKQRLGSTDLVYGRNIDPMEKLIQFIDKADKAINQLENETLRISSQLSTLLDIENEFSLVKQMHLITEAIHKSAEGITQCLDNERVQRIDRLMEDCRDIAAMMKEYGLLYQYNAQWKKQQRLKDK
ncbi:MlaD family protein [Chlamydia gallinacea]|uniref:MlaD family protein n=1 Tax=Chlamydia gallinacea TaxID=1457153 RepID=UPI0024E2154A|nr:MlaD family protein [Chlamydia gallinacea]